MQVLKLHAKPTILAANDSYEDVTKSYCASVAECDHRSILQGQECLFRSAAPSSQQQR